MSTTRSNPPAALRAALADALLAAGPEAPTLCEGWSTHDLAAHLVLREARLDLPVVLAADQVSALEPYAESILHRYRQRPFDELVQSFRSGPPALSGFSIPGVDWLVNGMEYGIHLLDVTRGRAGDPGQLGHSGQLGETAIRTLWNSWQFPLVLRAAFRRCPVPLMLETDDPLDRHSLILRAGVPRAILHAGTADVLLLASGRARAARWTVTGPEPQAGRLRDWLQTRD